MAWCKGLVADGKEAHEVEPASNEDTLLGNNDFLDQSGGRVCLVRLTERVESCWGSDLQSLYIRYITDGDIFPAPKYFKWTYSSEPHNSNR